MDQAISRRADARHARRNPRLEALRLAAIAGIAVFHAFQDAFAAATDGTLALGPAALSALGCVDLLGTFGNHVFFVVSGLFLVPRAAGAARGEGYWGAQLRATVRRAVPVLATMAFYALVALAADAWVGPLGDTPLVTPSSLVGGLQFIWVYLAVVCVTPLIGWVWARLRRPRALVCALTALVVLVNLYIAFVSPGSDERGLLEWRKLMSAASYLDSFLVGGSLAGGTSRVWPRRALVASVALAVASETGAALAGDLRLLGALSFKSTSPVSLALAVSLVALVARAPWDPGRAEGGVGRACCALARSILGFYVAQSILWPLWHPAADAALGAALAAGGEGALLAAGALVGLALLAVLLAADQLVRINLMRLLRLA
ncbi:acyltransferase family protein [Thermophilibacter sp.]